MENNTVGNKSNEPLYFKPPNEEGLINKTLPLEIFEVVLSSLDGNDMSTANYVNKLWSDETIDTAKKMSMLC